MRHLGGKPGLLPTKLPGAARSAQRGPPRLCREHAGRTICKIRTKHIVGKNTHFGGRHAKVAQKLVESQLQHWECLVRKILAGKSGKLFVEAVWMQKYGL